MHSSTARDLRKQSVVELGHASEPSTMLAGKAISPFYRGLARLGRTRMQLGCVLGRTRRLLAVLEGK